MVRAEGAGEELRTEKGEAVGYGEDVCFVVEVRDRGHLV